jgi:hypothetical protein
MLRPYGAASPAMPAGESLSEGMPVFGSEGRQAGTVKEVRDGAFRLDLPEQPDVTVPPEYVREVSAGRATLSVPTGEIGAVGQAPPPAAHPATT